MLRIENLTVRYPDRHGDRVAVEDVSLHVEAGEIHGLVGESGAGKSTIGAAIMGLIQPPGHVASGRIMLGETDLRTLSPSDTHKVRGRRISMIFQDPQTSLNPLLTIEEQLVETMRTHDAVAPRAARERAVALLEEIGISRAADRIRAFPHQFSGGMRQRVVIALALCTNPEIIIADEPTTALDVVVQAKVLDLLGRLARERGIGFILITHDIGVIAQVSDRVTVLRDGRVIESGPAPEVLGRPQAPYTRALIAAVPPLDRKIDRFHVPGGPSASSETAGSAAAAEEWLIGARQHLGGPDAALSIRNLTVRFRAPSQGLWKRDRAFTALDHVSLSVASGRVLGLVGESGSGKSTLARTIVGLAEPSAGEIRFAGRVLPPGRRRRRDDPVRRAIQVIFQDPFSSLNPRHRIGDILSEPLWLYGLEPDARRRTRLVASMLSLVGLSKDAIDRFPHQFSGGQRQRIAVARSLLARPDFLICDEPTSALDVSIQAQILNLLKDIQSRFGLTILFISHNLAVVRQMADEIAVLKDGRVVEDGSSEAFFAAPQAEYSRELLPLTPSLDRKYGPPHSNS